MMTQLTKRSRKDGGLPSLRFPQNAAFEVSTDSFVQACVTFEQAKSQLLAFFGPGTSVEAADNIGMAVVDLANKALKQRSRGVGGRTLKAVNDGKRLPFKSLIALAVKGKKTFTIDNVIDGLEKRKAMPESKNIRGYVSTALKTYEDTFQRIERGVYRMKRGAKLQLSLKRAPKQLPAPAATSA